MSYKHTLKIALRDPSNDFWSKWIPFPGLLWHTEWGKFGYANSAGLTAAQDVHRSILSNEIIIESDYPTYEENYETIERINKLSSALHPISLKCDRENQHEFQRTCP